MAGELVPITLPSGESATVPQADLAAALAAGAKATPTAPEGAYEAEFGGGLGQTASAIFGAGRMASGGVMDAALIDGAGLLGGDRSAAEMRHGLNVAKDTNKLATMGGEAAGLFLGAGEGVMGAGQVAEEAGAHVFGSGLLGRVGSMGLRGATEGALLGYQKAISEDDLGDVDHNGEKLFAASSKDALLGGAIGGGIGALSHFGATALGRMRGPLDEGLGAATHGPGPRSGALLDEVTGGTSGAGRPLLEDATAQESLIKDLQKTGLPSDEAATLAADVKTMARARTSGGPLSGLVDDRAAEFAASHANGNAERLETLQRGYLDASRSLGTHEQEVSNQALALSKHGTDLMRAEEALNRINFTERPEHFAKLLDPSKITEASDAAARMTSKVDDVVSSFERERMMGGEAVQVRDMRRSLTSLYEKQASLIDATTGAARENALRDMYMDVYRLKQQTQKMAGFGKAEHMLTPSEGIFRKVSEDLRVGLEDEAAFGRAGAANREWNETFSQALPRRQDFAQRFGVSIDAAGGVPKPEVDFEKARGFLKGLSGNAAEDEALQGTKSAGAYTDGLRARLGALEKYADMSAADKAIFQKAHETTSRFDEAFATARKESAIVSRLRTQALEEQGKSLGGVLGLATDLMTRPLQSIERLGALKAMTERFEKGVENGINRFFEGKGSAFMRKADDVISSARGASRSAEVVAKEIGDVRELAANPGAMEARVQRMVGMMSTFAPKTATSTGAVALRAMTYLAGEAPAGQTSVSLGGKATTRYSAQDLAVYENKRTAALHPETVVAEMRAGKLNRDGIKAVKAVYPALFAQMQGMAQEQILRMEQSGKLDAMPYAQKAAIATLLEVAPDGTWKPDFMALMQASKLPPVAPPAASPPQGGGRRPIKLDTDAFATEAQQVEGRTT